MAHEKPIPYERRARETKGIAQRLDLDYLKNRGLLSLWKSRLVWFMLGATGLGAIVLSLGSGANRKVLSRGPLSSPHALFEERCEVCHARAFNRIPDSACLKCHDGSSHPAKAIDKARLFLPVAGGTMVSTSPACSQCHIEHRGDIELTKVSDGNCTACHRNLEAHATSVKLKNAHITEFRRGKHPEFSPASQPDLRPLKLNHAAHMPVQPKVVRNIKLPMQCADCHVTDRNSPTGDMLPVTFEQHCKSCHADELRFDVYQVVYQVLKTTAEAPHTKDPQTIRDFITSTYEKVLAADPGIVRLPLGNDTVPQPNRAAWLEKVVSASELYLFQSQSGPGGRDGKCLFCHYFAGWNEGLPVVRKVDPIKGRFVEGSQPGEPWLERGEYSHRAHRALVCEECHTKARKSKETSDILIPVMEACLPCHAESRAGLDRCSECHLYHNKSLEEEKRRSKDQVLSVVKTGEIH